MKRSFRYMLACMLGGTMSLGAAAQQSEQASLIGDKVKVENLKVMLRDQKLVVDMDFVLDSLQMTSNNRIVFTPVVKNRTEELTMPPLVLNGRKQQIMYERHGSRQVVEGATVVRRQNDTPQTVHYAAVLPGEEWMKNANLVIEEDLCGCGDLLNQNEAVVKRMRTPLMAYIRPEAEARKERHVEGRAYVDFPVNKIELYPEYRKNPGELATIVETIRKVKDDKYTSITSICIHGYASPEDTYRHNSYLAENRARTLKDYVCRLSELDDSLFHVEYTPEDWEGLRKLVTESNLDNKEGILQLIDNQEMDIDVKEHAIRNRYPEDYRFMLSTWYPALRHSDYVVNYLVRPFTVEEAKEVLYTKPQLLSLEEMYMVAQSYELGSAEFNEVFEIAVRMYPDDPTANLNAACTRIGGGDYEGARSYLTKAGDTAEAVHARGVLTLMEGDEAQARTYLNRAAEMGLPQAEETLKLLDM